jgi:hypothetical protein
MLLKALHQPATVRYGCGTVLMNLSETPMLNSYMDFFIKLLKQTPNPNMECMAMPISPRGCGLQI